MILWLKKQFLRLFVAFVQFSRDTTLQQYRLYNKSHKGKAKIKESKKWNTEAVKKMIQSTINTEGYVGCDESGIRLCEGLCLKYT